MTNTLLHRSGKWPLTLVSAALGIGVIIALMAFANMADQSAVNREQSLLQNGFSGLLDEHARRPTAVALWDEAVRNLDVSYDPEWTDSNIGEYLAGVQDFDLAVVLDRADAPIYAKLRDNSGALTEVGSALAAASPLVEHVRAAERRRGPIADHLSDMGGKPPKVIYATSVSQTDLGPLALTATLVQPDFGLTLPETSRSAVLISGEVIDQDFLSILAKRYLLEDATLSLPGTSRLPGHAALTLRNSAMQDVAVIQWRPQRPGAEMLRLSMPLVFIALTALIILAMRYQRKGRQATERLVASEARVSHLAYHDAQTGLPNQLLLVDRLHGALETVRADKHCFALHCIDLDRFNEINDSLGQQAGDDLILAVSRLFANTLGPGDTLARLGKDEFAILQNSATAESAEAMAMRLIQLAAEPVEIAAGRVFTGCTVGVTLVEDANLDALECLRRADLAMNRAKTAGRAQYACFVPDMDGTLRMRLDVREDLRTALANGELSVAYQPQVHQGGKLYGVEALVRWNHPVRGNVQPSLFVPIAEESDLISSLGMFVMRRAFEDSKQMGTLRVAVNISAAQFRLSDFVSEVAALVSETGVDVGRIELEITEGLLLGDDHSTLETLANLRALGFRIALDDFGTGYSSLSYLQRYPIDKIKIDRSFISNLGTDPSADAVVNAIVRLARALRLDVIAEGVETELQRVRLAAAGCDDIQGYLFGKPMSVQAIQQLLNVSPARGPLDGHRAKQPAFG
jgi:diguanylate cyclase (GGDEF)-like protein